MSDHPGRRVPRSPKPEPLAIEAELDEKRPPELRSWRRLSLNRQRLLGETSAFREELRAKHADRGASAWWEPVAGLLEVAIEHAAKGQVSPGFEALNVARRIALEGLNKTELAAEARALRAEAEDKKLKGWRGEAIRSLLKPFEGSTELKDEEARAYLREALFVRDAAGQNTHRKHDWVARRYWWLVWVTVGAVILLILLSLWSPLDLSVTSIESSPGEAVTAEWSHWAYVFVLGVIGASVSAGLSLTKQRTDDSVPEVRAQTIPAVFRPVFGGAAAIGSFAILSAGLLAGLSVSNGTILSVAFLAGFSERLIDSVSTRVSAG